MSALSAIDARLAASEIAVICGSGGVGKTTVSAALALRAAELGRRVAVCTIDPARRLADALGIDMDGQESAPIDAVGPGELTALMLDTKRTFDRLVKRYARSEEMAERILANSLYQRISSQVSGTQEYMAMERLYELHQSGEYELIILDTPPTRHALDFLSAPERMARVLDHSSLRWILRPGERRGRSFNLFKQGLGAAARKVDEVLGMKVLTDLSEFFRAFDGMYEGFKERAEKVRELFQDPRTDFWVVTSPAEETLREAAFLVETLLAHKMPLRSLVINRFHRSRLARPIFGADLDADPAWGELARRAHRALADWERRAEADRARTAAGLPEAGALDFYWLPSFPTDVSDLEGLRRISGGMLTGDRHGPHQAEDDTHPA